MTLGAVATVTARINLMTSILLVPFRANAALVAKQAATVNHLSGGRLVLGMAVGGYEDDYAASGVPFGERGRRFDDMVGEMTRIWAGEHRGVAGAIGPAAGVGRSQIVFGGAGVRAWRRVARWGAGWIAGSRGAEAFRQGAQGVRQVWEEYGREGRPRLLALPYFALGSRARERGESFLTDHYAIEGRPVAERIAAAALTDPTAIREAIVACEQAGCDELMLFPLRCRPGAGPAPGRSRSISPGARSLCRCSVRRRPVQALSERIPSGQQPTTSSLHLWRRSPT